MFKPTLVCLIEQRLEQMLAVDAAPGEAVPKQDVVAEAPLETTIKELSALRTCQT